MTPYVLIIISFVHGGVGALFNTQEFHNEASCAFARDAVNATMLKWNQASGKEFMVFCVPK